MSPVSRFHDPVIARFISEDTYRGNPNDPLSLNLYTYCQNNPIRYIDPSGHTALTAKWSNNQYIYLHNLAAKGNVWAKQQISQKRYFVDEYGKVYSNKQVWNAKHPSTIDKVIIKATAVQFEQRDKLNGDIPAYKEVSKKGSGWILLDPSMSVFHDNGKGKSELKYINPDGREVVFDGDTLKPITDPQYKGTYNYVTPAPKPKSVTDVGGWVDFGVKGVGHSVVDVLPYYLSGQKNDRYQ